MGHLPRLWIPNQVMHGVIRTVDRTFLLKPSQAVNNIIGACLGRSLKKYPVSLHACMANTNHIHLKLSVTEKTLKNAAPFLQHLNGLLARDLNRHWKRKGHLWGGRIRLEACIDPEASDSMLAYVMSNPLKDDLVAKIDDWKGFSTHQQLLTGKPVSYEYTDRAAWWKQGGPLGKKPLKDFQRTVTVQTTPLPHWQHLTPREQRARYASLMDDAEKFHKERRIAEGKTVLGMPAIIRQDHRSSPRSRLSPTKRKPKPLCHASSKESWRCFMDTWKEFLNAYRLASAYYRSGIHDVEFPMGSFRPPLVTITGPP